MTLPVSALALFRTENPEELGPRDRHDLAVITAAVEERKDRQRLRDALDKMINNQKLAPRYHDRIGKVVNLDLTDDQANVWTPTQVIYEITTSSGQAGWKVIVDGKQTRYDHLYDNFEQALLAWISARHDKNGDTEPGWYAGKLLGIPQSED